MAPPPKLRGIDRPKKVYIPIWSVGLERIRGVLQHTQQTPLMLQMLQMLATNRLHYSHPPRTTSNTHLAGNCNLIMWAMWLSTLPRAVLCHSSCGVVVRHDAPVLVAPVWSLPRPRPTHGATGGIPAGSGLQIHPQTTDLPDYAHIVLPTRLIRRINCGDLRPKSPVFSAAC
jgi:hypothetical protein